ncbi:dioxygenase [Aeromicrobium sp. CTD01-1L150]|uniref:dioxygenase family protein n=1 Tax=Aeromicrobium sp. CTD01-1L150 TaxID=3341830 RepID=UPI0035BF67C6
MQHFDKDRSAEVVNARTGSDVDPRLQEVMASLVRHLHSFVAEVGLSQHEWDTAIDTLTRIGQLCSEERQEFILLSDILGVSMLVDALENQRPEPATQSTVLGPFHVAGSPVRDFDANISLDGKGEPCRFTGRVLDLEGAPIEGACVDVWSDNADGYYDVQQPGVQPQWNNRGRFITRADGRYSFRGIKPTAYPIPDDGPVGALLQKLGRHPNRPAHMHFLITASGFHDLVTHTFVAGDPFLNSDAVFGVKDSLVCTYSQVEDDRVTWQSTYDFVLAPVTG